MENLEGKYFERVIGELQKAKAKENFVLSSEFKSRLRSDLVARANLLMEKPAFDWSTFLNKWKYAFGAVPTLAILTVVAFNFANNKVVIKQTDFMPVIQNTGADMLKAGGNESNSVEDENKANLSTFNVVDNVGVKTFSAALALPPADVLERYRNDGNGQSKLVAPVTEVSSFSLDGGISQDVGSLKISDPKLQTFKFDFGSTTFDFSVKSNADAIQSIQKKQLNDIAPVQFENSNVQNNSVSDTSLSKFEESGRLESSGLIAVPVKTNDSMTNKTAPVQEAPVNKVLESNVNTVQPKSIETAPALNETEVKENADILKVSQVVDPAVTEYINPKVEMTKLADYNVSANTLMNQAMSVQPIVFDQTRVRYEGEDRELLVRLVANNFSGKTNFAPDYYIKVEKLLSGNLKVSLFEYGYISKVIFLSAADGFKIVTELNY